MIMLSYITLLVILQVFHINVVTTEEQIHRANEYQTWLREGNKEGGVGDPSKIHGVKMRSILHDLPYWKVMIK